MITRPKNHQKNLFSSQLITHLLKNVSNNCAECGNPSTKNSKGKSLATAAMLAGANFWSTAAASRNCRPSESTRTLRSTSFGLVGDVRSRLIRSPHSRISPHRRAADLWMLVTCCLLLVSEEAKRLAGINTERHTDTLGGRRSHGLGEKVGSWSVWTSVVITALWIYSVLEIIVLRYVGSADRLGENWIKV